MNAVFADRYARTQFTSRYLIPAFKPPIAVRALLLENYGKARDLFLRPEMYQHFLRYVMDLERLQITVGVTVLFSALAPTANSNSVPLVGDLAVYEQRLSTLWRWA